MELQPTFVIIFPKEPDKFSDKTFDYYNSLEAACSTFAKLKTYLLNIGYRAGDFFKLGRSSVVYTFVNDCPIEGLSIGSTVSVRIDYI